MKTADFLFELGCEELPPKALKRLGQGLLEQVKKELDQAKLGYQTIQFFASPRRLAVLVKDLSLAQTSQKIVRQGPSVDKAFDKNGTPTLACIGFARSCGVSADQLKTKDTDKGKRIFCEIEQQGQESRALLPDMIAKALDNLPINKPMRWGNSEKPFLRPVKWVVMLLDKEVVAAEFFGKKAGANTFGHRFHHPEAIKLSHPQEYEAKLKETGLVFADLEKRKHEIVKQIADESSRFGKALIDPGLLDEVTALVEYPNVLIGQFDPSFLQVPSEALITAMKVHQKCFPIVDNKNNLLPCFILVSNIKSKDPQLVIKGNERVITARLKDAAFFFEQDKKHPLSYFTEKLSHVVFQKSLGTLLDRTQRLSQISDFIAAQLKLNQDNAKRAASLAKFDLMTEMVGELPELQGVMGYHYALLAKEPRDIALAIKEHYYPRFSGDALPSTKIGAALALADRLDLIVGILGINKAPTGEKDPYALKRAALGVVRILIETSLPLNLRQLLETTYKTFSNLPNTDAVDQAYHFIMERMRSWYLEKNIKAELFAAVIATNPVVPLDFDQRLKAVQEFLHLPESSSLAAANKRVSNILKKSSDSGAEHTINEKLFESDVEKNLANLLTEKTKAVNGLYHDAQYTEALSELAALKEPVDRFFDEVMIMVDDKKIRNNRLTILRKLHQLFTQVADISLLSS